MSDGNPEIIVTIPDELGVELLAESDRRGITIQQVLLCSFAQVQGIEYTPRTQGRPRKPKPESDED